MATFHWLRRSRLNMNLYGHMRLSNQDLARSRRRAAIHEAGHFVVAEFLGYKPSKYYIKRRYDMDLYLRGYTGWVEIAKIDDPHHLRLFGVAGGVAECCWAGLKIVKARSLMSDSDWALTGCAPDEPDKVCRE